MRPKERTFEFKLSDQDDEIIKGKIGKAVQDVESLNLHLGEHVRIKVKRISVYRPEKDDIEKLGAPLWLIRTLID